MNSWRFRKLTALVLFGIFFFSCFSTWSTRLEEPEVKPAWERMRGIRLWELVRPLEETYILGPKEIKESPLVVIFVSSSPHSYKRRSAIRKTWAKEAKDKGVLVLFFVGTDMSKTSADIDKHIISEFKRHKDIVQDIVIEDPFQITVKTLRMMKYFLKTFVDNRKLSAGIPLFIKAEEDIDINLNNLMTPKMLQQLGFNPKTGSFQGRIIAGTRVRSKSMIFPERNHTSKLYMPRKDYMKNVYPPFLSGMFYSIGNSDFLKEVYMRSLNLLYFPFEDIFVSGIVANYLCRANIVDLNEVHNGGIESSDKDMNIVAYRIPSFNSTTTL